MKKLIYSLVTVLVFAAVACTTGSKSEPVKEEGPKKAVVYQVFTRLFGNQNTTNKPWGTIEENGIGKFNDFTDKALQEIKDLGVTHLWYTGVPHHATITDYTKYGISNDDPDVVKGRAGSPYAVKDYYQVDPDMAVDPAKRMEEFKALIDRTHKHGMKVIIDIVPNHVARKYEGKNNPEGVRDFGADDDSSVEYAKNNNFYYVPGASFKVPEALDGYKPLGGEKHPLSDAKFDENPAKWTGNGSRLAQPHHYDWYETVKINYGVQPDGTYDFAELPEGYDKKNHAEHMAFWQDKDVPDSWKKFTDIALFWIEMGVDGFRYDMAEMVPVEFWSYINSSIKVKKPDAFLMAEVYQPHLYRDYILKGKMDYLYDKVDLYDTLKHIMQGHGSTDNIAPIQKSYTDIEHNLLHFLENHDEQRIAAPEFAGDAKKGMPAMVVSATLSTSPTMIYFGQEVGEPAAEDAGFGTHSRTTIFDYFGVPNHQKWMNNGQFDGGQLNAEEKELRDFYKRLLNFTINSDALMGEYADIHAYNRENTKNYTNKVHSFVRWKGAEKLIVVSNFSDADVFTFDLQLPKSIQAKMGLKEGNHKIVDQLYGTEAMTLEINDGIAKVPVQIEPLQSYIFKIE
ncbi:alpha-amylase family glycosyl hydrolase [Saccharicrinis aurantiacus]|uniref:alpha-amylase family glycosyl hydrolase n=1 Tax=Saccharicrinis aurantiacus TaxID=1849719 RepID=UPI002491F581|nr:alpha-amylase family glycosyl hydrolase [Saccharicrinis aurantiacus]